METIERTYSQDVWQWIAKDRTVNSYVIVEICAICVKIFSHQHDYDEHCGIDSTDCV